MLLMHVGQATAPALYAKLPFDPVGDFAPIGLVTDVPMILVARAEFSRQGPEGTGRPCARPGRQGHLWQCRPRLRVASVRADVHERHRNQAHADLLQGRRPRAERHHRRSHRRLLRSRHRTDALYSGRHHPGLRHHQQEAGADACRTCRPRRKPACRNSTSRPGMACMRRSNTPKPIVDALVDALQKALKDPPLVNRFAELSMAPVEEERATPAALEAFSRPRS